MTIDSSQVFESFVPVYDAVPDEWKDARPFIVETLKKMSNAINIREIGWFLDEELLSGKQFIPTSATTSGADPNQQFRTILRKVIDFGTLPNTGTKSVPHGIVFNANFTLMQIYGAATDPVSFFGIPIPYAATAPIQTVQIFIDQTNINITTLTNQTQYTRCFVVIEYIQEI